MQSVRHVKGLFDVNFSLIDAYLIKIIKGSNYKSLNFSTKSVGGRVNGHYFANRIILQYLL